MSDVVYGIDLGTTFCVACSAVVRSQGEPETRTLDLSRQWNAAGTLLESRIALRSRGARFEAVVGCQVRDPQHSNATVVEGAKRNIGVAVDERLVWPVGEVEVDAVVASALILRKIAQGIDPDRREPIQAVVTHPRDFEANKKALTAEAIRLAGIDLLDTLNEPEAAAYAYFDPDREVTPGYYLVFDLGGGTLDIAVLKAEEGERPRVIGGLGDAALGGLDWDRVTKEALIAELEQYYGWHDLEAHLTPASVEKLSLSARAAKHRFSEHLVYRFCEDLDHDTAGKIRAEATLHREQWEGLCEGLVERARDAVVSALRNSKLAAADIRQVLVVGGSTRLRRVRAMLQELFPGPSRLLTNNVDPDLAIATGAARYARMLALRKAKVQSTTGAEGLEALLDLVERGEIKTVLPHGLNVKVAGKSSQPGQAARPELQQVIAAHSRLPAAWRGVLKVREPGKALIIEFYEGEAGLWTPGLEPSLQVTFPTGVSAQAGDEVEAQIEVLESGQVQATAVHRRSQVRASAKVYGERDGEAKHEARVLLLSKFDVI